MVVLFTFFVNDVQSYQNHGISPDSVVSCIGISQLYVKKAGFFAWKYVCFKIMVSASQTQVSRDHQNPGWLGSIGRLNYPTKYGYMDGEL